MIPTEESGCSEIAGADSFYVDLGLLFLERVQHRGVRVQRPRVLFRLQTAHVELQLARFHAERSFCLRMHQRCLAAHVRGVKAVPVDKHEIAYRAILVIGLFDQVERFLAA